LETSICVKKWDKVSFLQDWGASGRVKAGDAK
jgi:hypothetical protein